MIIRVLAANRDAADRAFGDVVVDLQPAIIEEPRERSPALAAIGDGLGHLGLGREASQGVVEGGAQRLDQRRRSLQPAASSDVWWCPSDLFLDPVEGGDTRQQVGSERRRLGRVDIEDLAPEMRPAGDLGDAVGGVELVVTGIAVHLQEPGKAGELLLGVAAGAILGELIPDQRRRGVAGAAIVDDIGPDPAGCGLAGPGSSIGTGVSSVWILVAVSPASRMRLTIGSSSADA
jgi:hypothetical protein